MPKKTPQSPRLHRNPQPTPNWSAYAVHLTRYNIDEVLHYVHPIPNARGYTTKFFDEHYPGWNLVIFLGVFKAASILLKDGPGSLAGRCHWQLRGLHFNNADSLAVEWNESIVADDGLYYYLGDADSGRSGNGAFLSAIDPDATDEEFEILANQLVQQLGS